MTLTPTASLGKLVIDEKNGYIGICKRTKYKEKHCTWIPITDIDDVALCCVKPRMTSAHSVKCDCEFSCHIISENRDITKTVKTRVSCNHRRARHNPQMEEWDEPGIVSMMRSIINQTYINAVNNEWKEWREKLIFIQESAFEQARCAFMLPFPFTHEQLENHYQKLSSVFDSYEDVKLLNQYYQILKGTL